MGGPSIVDWVVTEQILAEFQGDPQSYRAYVEAGKGEKQVSPFERATAGLVLGGESFVRKVRTMLQDREESPEQPALKELRRSGKPSMEALEAAVEELFGHETKRRRGRLKLYALRQYSGLGATAIAERYSRRHSAVAMAVKAIEAEASKSPALASRLAQLFDTVMERKSDS